MTYRIDAKKTWRETHDALSREFERWGIVSWSAVPNVQPHRVNAPAHNRSEAAVTVRWSKGDSEIVLMLDTQPSPKDNLRALYLCVEAMRLIEARGVSDLVRSAYLQLDAPQAARDPYELLGVRPDAPLEVVEASYRALAKAAHPDAGGSGDAMAELNAALERVRADRAVTSA